MQRYDCIEEIKSVFGADIVVDAYRLKENTLFIPVFKVDTVAYSNEVYVEFINGNIVKMVAPTSANIAYIEKIR